MQKDQGEKRPFLPILFLLTMTAGILLISMHLLPKAAASLIPAWPYFQRVPYQVPPPVWPAAPFPFYPPAGNSPWLLPEPFFPYMPFGQTSFPVNRSFQSLPWGMPPVNQFFTAGLPGGSWYGWSGAPLPYAAPLRSSAAVDGFFPGSGQGIPFLPSGPGPSDIFFPPPGVPSLYPVPLAARTAAATLPPLPPAGPAGIDVPQFQYKPPAGQSLGVTYVPGLPSYVGGQILVTFRPGTPPMEMNRVYALHQCRELYTSLMAGFKVVGLPSHLTVMDAARRFSAEPSVLYAGPNYYRHAHLIPNDPYYRYQWHLPRLNCSYAWDYSTGAGAVVGLLDSGVSYQTAGVYALAPDLAGTLIVPGYDFINDDAFPDDDYGHGTHMAGCIAQTTNNFVGVAGVGFNATIMAVKVMDNTGSTPISSEVEGIYYAVNNGVNIINMSLGGAGTDATEQAAVTAAYNSGVSVICSAGNAGSSVPEYPASYPECISVSAIRYDYTLPAYSNYGLYVDVCAPGGDLSVDQNADGFGDGILQQTHNGTNFTTFYYYFMEGTSPACALVSGVAALIVSKSTVPLTALDVTNILTGSATDLGTAGWDQYFGYGLVNAYLAVLQTP
ncbi:MAG: S8 family serine peptidase [bacterium]